MNTSRYYRAGLGWACAALLSLGAAGCKKEAADVRDDWQEAGLEGATLEATDAVHGAERCKAGKVNGLYVTLCEFASEEAAAAAQEPAVGAIAKMTGLALARDNLLLVLDDRDKTDPSGRTINKVAKVFWGDRKTEAKVVDQ